MVQFQNCLDFRHLSLNNVLEAKNKIKQILGFFLLYNSNNMYLINCLVINIYNNFRSVHVFLKFDLNFIEISTTDFMSIKGKDFSVVKVTI